MNTYLILLLSSQQPRRQRVIENVLLNRRTVTTLFWGARYDILCWLGSDRQLKRQSFELQLKEMQKNGIIKIDNQFISLTKHGQTIKEEFVKYHYVPKYYQYYLLHNLNAGWPRLMLASQVISEFSYKNSKYAPISFEEQELHYVKQWFTNNKSKQLVNDFKQEIIAFLLTLNDFEAQFFTELLVGYQNPGLSIDQLAIKLSVSNDEGEILANDLIAGMMNYAEKQTLLLKQLFQDLTVNSPISHSGNITYQMFKKGLSIEQIEGQRQLKLSTIREHLLECAIFDGYDFPYHKLLTKAQIEWFTVTYQGNVDEWQMKTISNDKNLDFFNFRLFQIMKGLQNG